MIYYLIFFKSFCFYTLIFLYIYFYTLYVTCCINRIASFIRYNI